MEEFFGGNMLQDIHTTYVKYHICTIYNVKYSNKSVYSRHKPVCRSRSNRTLHEQLPGSKLGKEYEKAVYCHPAYLTCMQSTPREMPGWMKHKLESRLQEGIPTTSDIQIIPL